MKVNCKNNKNKTNNNSKTYKNLNTNGDSRN